MEILFQTIHYASVELQGSTIIQSSAVKLLQNTKQNIQKLRNDTFSEKINNSGKLVAEKTDIIYENSSRNSVLYMSYWYFIWSIHQHFE